MAPAGSRLRAVVGLGVAQLRHYRVRTTLAVVSVALAVLSVTLLASVGVGVVETGEGKFEAANQDLWVTGGPVRFAPGSVGGFENTIHDAHRVADEIGSHEAVGVAAPIAFQTVYVGRTPDDLRTLVGVGVPNVGTAKLQLESGPGFEGDDVHYADGDYDGPMTREVIIDPRTAALLDVGVGDTIHVGGTVASASRNAFTVVGVSPTFSRFLGTPAVTLHLSELQEVTGTTGTDSATMITVALRPGADVSAVEADLEARYPSYEVNTNREQLESVLGRQAVVVAAAGTLVVLAVVSGFVLTVNVLALLVFQQRTELAALRAAGVSAATLVGAVAVQGLLLGGLGGSIGIALTPIAGNGLSTLAERVVGFEGLVRTPRWVFVAGAVIAVGIGTAAAVTAAWRVTRIGPLAHLRR